MISPYTDYRLIPLTQGQFAKVDASDFEWLSQWKWHVKRDRGGVFYAERKQYVGDDTQITVMMHREILGLEIGDSRISDHISGDTLDNRRCNLRCVNHAQNMQNRKLGSNSSSGLKGVCWHSRDERWTAYIKHFGRRIHLGNFGTKEEAHASYMRASSELHGEYARKAGL